MVNLSLARKKAEDSSLQPERSLQPRYQIPAAALQKIEYPLSAAEKNAEMTPSELPV